MSRTAAQLDIVPTGAALGADVRGLDVAAPLDEATFAAVYKAWNEHLVLRFRGQSLDDDQLAAFSRRFGELDKAPVAAKGSTFKRHRDDVAVISNIVVDGKAIGGLGNSELVWHQDMSYAELPPKASLLYGLEVPDKGGETFFYNLYEAYRTLPERLKARIAGLACKHDATRNSSGQLRQGFAERYGNAERPGAIHPLVIRHPDTGRPSLYLGRRPNAWIVGLSDSESEALLDELWAHVESGPYSWAQEWQKGDLVIWDNRCTLHRRNQLDPALRRLMHRTQVKDTVRPVGA
jgi:taurine dioxygenase